MLVKDLISFLNTLDKNLEISLLVPDSGGYDYTIDKIDLNQNKLKITTIEICDGYIVNYLDYEYYKK